MVVLLINGTKVSGEDYKLSQLSKKNQRRYLKKKQQDAQRRHEIEQYDEIVLDELRANGIL